MSATTGAIVAVSTTNAAQDLIRRNLYRTVVNGTYDINEVAKLNKMSYKSAVRWLRQMIKMANAKSKWMRMDFTALVGAHIDDERERIVLVASTDDLIVFMGHTNNLNINAFNILGWVLLLSNIFWIPLLIGASDANVIIGASLGMSTFTLLGIFMLIMMNYSKKLIWIRY